MTHVKPQQEFDAALLAFDRDIKAVRAMRERAGERDNMKHYVDYVGHIEDLKDELAALEKAHPQFKY